MHSNLQQSLSAATARWRAVFALIPICMLLVCTEPKRDNPFDPLGENWHRPVVSLLVEPAQAMINDTITFTAKVDGSQDKEFIYHWFFNDSLREYAHTTAPVFKRVWDLAQLEGAAWVDMKVFVAVTDPDGPPSDTVSNSVRINSGAPRILDFGTSQTGTSQNKPLLLTVNAVDSNGAIANYYWDIDGDGWDDSSTTNLLTIPYPPGGGLFNLLLGVTDTDGILVTRSLAVLFNRAPSALSMTAPGNGAQAAWYTYSGGSGQVRCTFSAIDPDSNIARYRLSYRDSIETKLQLSTIPEMLLSELMPSTRYNWILTAYDHYDDSVSTSGSFTTSAESLNPVLSISTDEIGFGLTVLPLTFTISNTGKSTLSWTAASDKAWIFPFPISGSSTPGASSTVSVTVNRLGMTGGIHTGKVYVNSNGGNDSLIITMQVSQSVIVRVVNSLLDSTLVWSNGTLLGKVPGSDSVDFPQSNSDSLRVNFELIRPKTAGGTMIGDEIAAEFTNTRRDLQPIERFLITNVVGSSTYFCPVIINSTSSPLLMVVNWGLADENRCYCEVPANSNGTRFGYYRLYTGTDVRAYVSGSDYLSSYIYWSYATISSWLQTESGETRLQCTNPPTW